jgi:hypothetical protein
VESDGPDIRPLKQSVLTKTGGAFRDIWGHRRVKRLLLQYSRVGHPLRAAPLFPTSMGPVSGGRKPKRLLMISTAPGPETRDRRGGRLHSPAGCAASRPTARQVARLRTRGRARTRRGQSRRQRPTHPARGLDARGTPDWSHPARARRAIGGVAPSRGP